MSPLRVLRSRLPTPRLASPEVSGRTFFNREAFIRHLGKTTWDLWYRLICLRGKDGLVRHSVSYAASLRGFPRLSGWQSKNALRRLQQAGLVVPTSRWETVECATGPKKVRVRLVRGMSVGTEEVVLPAATALQVKTLHGKGRPKRDDRYVSPRRIRRQERIDRALGAGEGVENGSPVMGGIFLNATYSPPSFDPENATHNLSSYSLRDKSGVTASLKEREGAAQPHHSLPVEAKPGVSNVIKLTRDDRTGTSLTSSTKTQPLIRPSFIPPYPGISQVSPVTVPNPPLLDPKAEPREWVQRMLAAYRGAVDARYGLDEKGRGCGVLLRGDITRARFYKGFVEAARALIEHEIPPAAWALWYIDAWREHVDEGLSKKAPPVHTVFSAKRINERRGWFRRESESYLGGRVLIGKVYKQLLDRYTAMYRELPRTSDPAALFAKHFPDGEYNRLLEAARQESLEDQARLRRLVARGEFVWGT